MTESEGEKGDTENRQKGSVICPYEATRESCPSVSLGGWPLLFYSERKAPISKR